MGRDVYIVENKKTNKNKFLYLGKNSKIPGNPDKFVLQKINNPHLKVDYIVRFKIPEFTCFPRPINAAICSLKSRCF